MIALRENCRRCNFDCDAPSITDETDRVGLCVKCQDELDTIRASRAVVRLLFVFLVLIWAGAAVLYFIARARGNGAAP